MNIVTNHRCSGYDDPNTLVVLTEEELIVIDLLKDSWPCYQLPYLASLHCSAITATAHVSNVPQTLWDKMTDAGQRQLIGYSASVYGACILLLLQDFDYGCIHSDICIDTCTSTGYWCKWSSYKWNVWVTRRNI